MDYINYNNQIKELDEVGAICSDEEKGVDYLSVGERDFFFEVEKAIDGIDEELLEESVESDMVSHEEYNLASERTKPAVGEQVKVIYKNGDSYEIANVYGDYFDFEELGRAFVYERHGEVFVCKGETLNLYYENGELD